MGKKGQAGKGSSGNEELHEAARSGDLKAVQSICSSNPLAVNSRDRHSRTPLHLAAWSGHSEIVTYLCKNRADVAASAMDDMGAIHFAAQKGHLEIVKTLITSGVSVRSCNRKGMTALHYAVQGSNLGLVKYLLKKGSNKDSKNKAGKTALDLASSDELRNLLVEFEPKKEGQIGKNDEGEGGKTEEASCLRGDETGEEEKDETLKRKGEDEIIKEDDSKVNSKKPKVALSHLLASDDTVEDEE